MDRLPRTFLKMEVVTCDLFRSKNSFRIKRLENFDGEYQT